jgi:hypothetical protein
MGRDRHLDGLMDRLLRAIECSLGAAEAARETVEEILKRGADTSIFFADAALPPGDGDALTPQDREFLRTLAIRPDSA